MREFYSLIAVLNVIIIFQSARHTVKHQEIQYKSQQLNTEVNPFIFEFWVALWISSVVKVSIYPGKIFKLISALDWALVLLTWHKFYVASIMFQFLEVCNVISCPPDPTTNSKNYVFNDNK